jgi:hypothetical protein
VVYRFFQEWNYFGESNSGIAEMRPKKHDVVVFDGRRGVVMDTREELALVCYSLPKSPKMVGQGWLHINRITVVARRRSMLTGEEPENLRILEV